MPTDCPSLFVIVGKNDNLLYQTEIGKQESSAQKKEATHLSQFILHSALDVIDDQLFKSSLQGAMYLKTIDRFNQTYISAFVTAANVKFLLLHEKKDEDGIKLFFQDVYELYLKILLNPFYAPNTPITSTAFNEKVKGSSKRRLDW